MKSNFSRRDGLSVPGSGSAAMEAMSELFSTVVLLLLLVPFVLTGRLRAAVGPRRRAEPS